MKKHLLASLLLCFSVTLAAAPQLPKQDPLVDFTEIKVNNGTWIDKTGNAVITPGKTAMEMGSGTLPVYATPAMIALMEKTAMLSVAAELSDDEATVGTRLEISHLAASGLGAEIRCESILAEIGMTIEDATALFLKAVVARKGLPFPLTEAELDEIRNRRKEGKYDLRDVGHSRQSCPLQLHYEADRAEAFAPAQSATNATLR